MQPPEWTQSDLRIDPRIRAVFAMVEPMKPWRGTDREEFLATALHPKVVARREQYKALLDKIDNDHVAPSAGLEIADHELTSQPDGNTIKVRFVRPEGDEPLPCVVYLHGGGMFENSAYDGNYRAWSKIVAAQGVAVAMVEFRNAAVPSAVPETGPFPAGLNDCVSAIRWVHARADDLAVDPRRIVVAGESGGGNLAIASCLQLKRDGDLDLVSGLYALCPFILGDWPNPDFPSSITNNGIMLDVHGDAATVSYGREHIEARNPLAWPGFATEDDVRGFPPTVVHVNECDPLRDEGVWFYRLLLRAGVRARCRDVIGTIHATEVMPAVCPEISADGARAIAAFAHEARGLA